ncbi:DUF3368 domain-containing protein [Candidatus Pacearchaeota archaeon]|nr:DUF3368 domain-containing protein [Candidatus Pacearchaeota archaeon]
MIISNSSPLIYLSKLDRLYLLKDLFKKILIPNEVYEEVVVVGKQKNFYDSLKIENAIREGWIVIKEVNGFKELEMFSSEIDLGELAVIKLAKKENPELILIDDASARVIAESFGFKVRGTIYVLLSAYKRKLIKKTEIKDLIDNLVLTGFRISQEFYIQIMKLLEDYKS